MDKHIFSTFYAPWAVLWWGLQKTCFCCHKSFSSSWATTAAHAWKNLKETLQQERSKTEVVHPAACNTLLIPFKNRSLEILPWGLSISYVSCYGQTLLGFILSVSLPASPSLPKLLIIAHSLPCWFWNLQCMAHSLPWLWSLCIQRLNYRLRSSLLCLSPDSETSVAMND